MISFEEAYRLVTDLAHEPTKERISMEKALHRVLAEEVLSDIDMPPFDKSAVDGYACRRDDLFSELAEVEVIPAGVMPQHPIRKGQCARIMTGAIVPEGADMVMMVEDSARTPEGKIRFIREKSAVNICYQAEDIRKGERVLQKGVLLRPQEIAVMASVGYADPLVYRQPRIGVISTGDELVEPDQSPLPSQIRNSNASQLMAQIAHMGISGTYHGIARDTKAAVRERVLTAWHNSDVIILTGGVSMGEYDYVVEVLRELDVEILFESIAIQPGRPTVFGRGGAVYIFGLPGNPVSSFVIFEFLIKPFLYRMMGHFFRPLIYSLPLGTDYSRKRTERKSLIPVTIREGKVFPVTYHGSAHIHAYLFADGIMVLEKGTSSVKEGEWTDVRQI